MNQESRRLDEEITQLRTDSKKHLAELQARLSQRAQEQAREIAQRDQRILVLELQHQLDQLEKRLPAPKL